MLATEPEVDMVPDRDTLEYVEYLIEKATPKTDAPMVVDWIPHVKNLVGMVKELRREYEVLLQDYDDLKVKYRRELWKSESQQESASSSE